MRIGKRGIVLLLVFSSSCAGERLVLPSPAHPLSATPEESFRISPPEPGPARNFFMPHLEMSHLENGLTLVLLRTGERSKVSTLRYVTRRGGEDLPTELAGRAWLVGRAIERKLGMDVEGGLSVMEGIGGYENVDVGYDRASVSAVFPAINQSEALRALGDAIIHPAFDSESIDSTRQKALTNLKRLRGDREGYAYYRARAMLYGLDHRAASPVIGNAEAVREVSAAELMAFHHISWAPSQSALILVGNASMDEFYSQAAEAFGNWAPQPAASAERDPWLALDSPNVARALGLSNRRPWCQVLLMERAPSGIDDDAIPYSIFLRLLAGMRSSHLTRSLRRFPGDIGAIGTAYERRTTGGELVITIRTSRRKLADVLFELFDEVDRLLEEGPGEDELAQAKRLEREQLLSQLEGSGEAAALIEQLFIFGQDPRQLEGSLERIDTITTEQVRTVARRWFRPDRAPIVVTGDLDSIGFAFNTTAIGPAVLGR